MKLEKMVIYTKQRGPGSFPFRDQDLALLQKAAPDTRFVVVDWDESRLLQEADGCTAAVAQNNRPLPPEFFSRAADLKWVHCMMSGVDQMRVPGSGHVILTSTKGVHGVPLSEHVLAMMLSCARKLHLSRDSQLQRQWQRPPGITELNGATVGIVGLGLIGTEVARLLRAVGMRVIAASRSTPASERLELLEQYYPPQQFDSFLAQCDYIVISAPLTGQTRHMFSADQFRLMKPSAWIINIARGPIIDEDALRQALEGGQIAGACLDVAATEPRPPDDPLWTLPNVIITPHTANASPRKMDRIISLLLDNVRRFQQGAPLLFEEK